MGRWTKTEVGAILTPKYLSSDKSGYSEDNENGKDCVSRYLVKHLPWERSRLTREKQTLDNVYLGTLTKQVRNARLQRSPHPQNYTRPIPESPEAWAVRTVIRFIHAGTGTADSRTDTT